MIVLSDQLTVRNYSSHEAWAPGPMRVQAGDALPPVAELAAIVSFPVISVCTLSDLTLMSVRQPEPQRALVVQLCQRTSLTVKFSVDCLEGNGWDLDRAFANFEQVKVSTALLCALPTWTAMIRC